MTIHPELEIVTTSHDEAKRAYTYVIARGGKRWSVTIPDSDFEKFGPMVGASAAQNKLRRRQFLASCLEGAMNGPCDE